MKWSYSMNPLQTLSERDRNYVLSVICKTLLKYVKIESCFLALKSVEKEINRHKLTWDLSKSRRNEAIELIKTELTKQKAEAISVPFRIILDLADNDLLRSHTYESVVYASDGMPFFVARAVLDWIEFAESVGATGQPSTEEILNHLPSHLPYRDDMFEAIKTLRAAQVFCECKKGRDDDEG